MSRFSVTTRHEPRRERRSGAARHVCTNGPCATTPSCRPAQIFMSSQRRRRLHPAPRARRGAGFLRFCSESRSWLTRHRRPTGVPRVVIRSLDWPKCCHVAEASRHCQTADRPRFRACRTSASSAPPLFVGQSDVRVAGHGSDIRRPSESTVPTVLHPCHIEPTRILCTARSAPLPISGKLGGSWGMS